jgi:WD40 repeat protein
LKADSKYDFGNYVQAVRSTPNGSYLVSLLTNGTANLWSIEEGALLDTFDNVFLLSLDGRRMLRWSQNGITVIDIETRATQEYLGLSKSTYSRIAAEAYCSKRSFVALGMESEVHVWDLNSGKLLKAFDGHSDIVMSLCFSPDGRYVVSGSGDGTIRIWEVG